ncbi:MAG: UbiA family prenyltransferase [Nocardioides sp.]
MPGTSALRALGGAAHPGPALAVTVLTGLLSIPAGLAPGEAALVTAAVLAGQLSIGWSNDLIDLARDRQVGRIDKPLATGAVSPVVVRAACAVAVAATVALSLACGLVAGVVHLGCVAAGWAYNLGVKSTLWSWVPYALAFGGLPVFVQLAGSPSELPPLGIPLAGALLGVGAHLVNVLPDLADDAATGIRGLPHRLGPTWAPVAAVAVLVAASVSVAVGTTSSWRIMGPALGLVAVLAVVALVVRGQAPFRAAIGIALVDVMVLVWAR